jgi:UDP-N-acetylmuramate--alanine ligase
MNAVAQLLVSAGYRVTGSDRFLDQGTRLPVLDQLEALGVELVPQDGAVLTQETQALILSTAVEADNPERVAAKRLGVAEKHRSEALADCVRDGALVAVAGTSGKTTCTGWLGWVLAECGLDPNVVNGGGILGWKNETRPGNVRVAQPDGWWVVEVDESDRSLLRFDPKIALINTISEDHHSFEDTVELFRDFAARVRDVVVCGPGVRTYLEGVSSINARLVDVGEPVEISLPGQHNQRNAAAVKAVAEACGCDPQQVDAALKSFRGIERRLELCSPPGVGPRVYDDYGHNPEKIAAAMQAVRPVNGRLIVLWRPHGFAPLLHNFDAFVTCFAEGLREQDEARILPVFYVGGTAPDSVCSDDLVRELTNKGKTAVVQDTYPENLELGPEDVLLVMGARDPELPLFAGRMGRGRVAG